MGSSSSVAVATEVSSAEDFRDVVIVVVVVVDDAKEDGAIMRLFMRLFVRRVRIAFVENESTNRAAAANPRRAACKNRKNFMVGIVLYVTDRLLQINNII